MFIKILSAGVKRTRPTSCQRSVGTEEGETAINWSTGSSAPKSKELLHNEDDGALAQAAQGGCGFSLSGDIPHPPGRPPVQPAVGSPFCRGVRPNDLWWSLATPVL